MNDKLKAFGELLEIMDRITSYNVCYTKLLRGLASTWYCL